LEKKKKKTTDAPKSFFQLTPAFLFGIITLGVWVSAFKQ